MLGDHCKCDLLQVLFSRKCSTLGMNYRRTVILILRFWSLFILNQGNNFFFKKKSVSYDHG